MRIAVIGSGISGLAAGWYLSRKHEVSLFEKEPRLYPGLAKLENVVLLPHIGSVTLDIRGQMAVVAAKNAIAMVRGKKPQNIVNPEVFGSSEYRRRLNSLKSS